VSAPSGAGTGVPVPVVRGPVTGSVVPCPRPVSAQDREAFDALAREALPAVQKMAAAWRTGLAGLITLVTTGIVLTGRTATTSVTVPWRVGVTVAVGAGLGLAIVGLWQALAAEVGARTTVQSLEDIRSGHASVQAWKVGQAAIAGRRLHKAKALVGVALGLLLCGVLATWWAPPAPQDPPAYLEVVHSDGAVCGVLTSADGGTLRVRVAGTHDLVAIPLTSITNLTLTPECP
jgi:hypothetical protein